MSEPGSTPTVNKEPPVQPRTVPKLNPTRLSVFILAFALSLLSVAGTGVAAEAAS